MHTRISLICYFVFPLLMQKHIIKKMVETKTAQYVHDIELHFTEKEKRRKQEIKKISIEIKRM